MQEKRVSVNAYLTNSLHRQLIKEAKRTGQSQSGIIGLALANYFSVDQEPQINRKLTNAEIVDQLAEVIYE